MPPLPVKSSGVIFERAARKLGWHPSGAMAILSSRRDAAPVSIAVSAWHSAASRRKIQLPRHRYPHGGKNRRCEIRPNSSPSIGNGRHGR